MSRVLALAAVIVPPACAAADAARPAVELDHAALRVADLEASVAFYADVFGLREKPAPGDPAVIRWLDLGDAELHPVDVDGDVPPTDKAVHVALHVADLDAVVARAQLGVPYSDGPGAAPTVGLRPDGVRQIYVQDPDGHWTEVDDVR